MALGRDIDTAQLRAALESAAEEIERRSKGSS
jgi:hypothetical protein